MSTSDAPPTVTPGKPAPIGALGQALVQVLAPIQTAVLVITLVVTFGLLFLAMTADAFLDAVTALGERIGTGPAIVVAAILAAGFFTAAVAVIAFLPPLLLRGADREVMAVHSWIGAREVRRVLGRASRAAQLIGTPEAARRWLEVTPPSDEVRPIRFEALLIAGRFDEARIEADALPQRTPLESYRRLEALAMVDDQTGLPFEEERLREAVAAIPAGVDRTEADVSLAVTLARRALPDGDWRAPLLEVRDLLPESDFVLLTRDFGLTIFDLLARRILVPFLILFFVIALVTAILPTFLR
jgi:hypothetical protein